MTDSNHSNNIVQDCQGPPAKGAEGSVSDPGKGRCADPVNEDAILGRVGGGRPGQNRKRQFSPDTGEWETDGKIRKTTPSRLRVTLMHGVCQRA